MPDLKSVGSLLEKIFKKLDEWQHRMSSHWREHTNRRTIVILIVLGAIAIFSYIYIIEPPDSFPTDKLVTVPEGASSREVGRVLKKNGVIQNATAFDIVIAILGRDRGVHAGDYLFKQPEDLFTIAHAVSVGQFGLEPMRIRVPEGATTKEMADIFAVHLQRFDSADFLQKAQPMEGYLFPDTYYFLPNATEDTVIQALRQNFDTHEVQFDSAVQSSGHTLSDIMIMASIIEREARIPDDRRKISGVLWNRIKRGMPLQVDVTFLYTIGKGTFQLTTADLKSDSPYNTYVHKGLPPGPIGSPSMDSIQAAINPIKSDYLYYLADRSGVTHFSKTYEEHLHLKAQYLGT